MTDPCKTAQNLFGASGRVTVRWTRDIWRQQIKRTWDLSNPEHAKRALDEGAIMMDAHEHWVKACKEWDKLNACGDKKGYHAHYRATAPAHLGLPINNDNDARARGAGCLRYNPVIEFKITKHRK